MTGRTTTAATERNERIAPIVAADIVSDSRYTGRNVAWMVMAQTAAVLVSTAIPTARSRRSPAAARHRNGGTNASERPRLRTANMSATATAKAANTPTKAVRTPKVSSSNPATTGPTT